MQMFQHPLGRLDFQKYKNVANKCKGKELKLMIFLEKSFRFFLLSLQPKKYKV